MIRSVRAIVWFTARTIAYVLATWAAIFLLDVNLQPPGFTGRGFLALLIPIFGSWRVAKDCKSRIFFFVFGFVAAVPILLLLFSESDYVFSLYDIVTAWRYCVVSILFLTAIGLICVYVAVRRWHKDREARGFDVVLGGRDKPKGESEDFF